MTAGKMQENDATQAQWKRQVAEAALAEVREDSVLGVGTGSTVNAFIDALAASGIRIEAAVSSSEETSRRLEAAGIRLVDLNGHRRLIKGGGGALTREKIIAEASRRFLCIADESKRVGVLGAFPLPVEVIPMARSLVARKLVALGGQPEWRQSFVTDNGNLVLDVHHLDLVDPVAVERTINDIPGVVTCGIFALRPADQVLSAGPTGLKTY
jgi:ribose 5-phosphate isomerase A